MEGTGRASPSTIFEMPREGGAARSFCSAPWSWTSSYVSSAERQLTMTLPRVSVVDFIWRFGSTIIREPSSRGEVAIIKNRAELVAHGNGEEREVILKIAEEALEAVDPYHAVKRLVTLEDEHTLKVGDLAYDLSEVGNIYVLGAGKATFPIAKALDEILGNRIRAGRINVKSGERRRLRHIKVREAGHPLPDEMGLEGAKEILLTARKAGEDDLVLCCFTGGSSATCPLPPEGVPLIDKRRLTELLLRCGATIQEINAVRKHVSRIKGGRLAQEIHPAHIVNLTVSDVVGDPLDCITDLTVPDTSTMEDALRVLHKYDLWDKVPESIRRHLTSSDPGLETPKELRGVSVYTFMLATNEDMCSAAKRAAEQMGYRAEILSSMMEGEAREVGIVLASIARYAEGFGRPLKPPCVFISGGETTVTLPRKHGQGGRNQELILSLALKAEGSMRISAAAIASDGTDGPTDIAGGIIDGHTLARAAEAGLDISGELAGHNSSDVLTRLGDAIITGPTGTNVMDLHIVLVGAG